MDIGLDIAFEIIQAEIVSRGFKQNLCLLNLGNFHNLLSPQFILEHSHHFVIFLFLNLVFVLDRFVVEFFCLHTHDFAYVIQWKVRLVFFQFFLVHVLYELFLILFCLLVMSWRALLFNVLLVFLFWQMLKQSVRDVSIFVWVFAYSDSELGDVWMQRFLFLEDIFRFSQDLVWCF